jgi:hypothetical protein
LIGPRILPTPAAPNAMVRRLAAGLTELSGTQQLYPVEANEIFIVIICSY